MIQRKTPMRRSYEAKLKHAWNPALKAPPSAKKPKAKLGAGKKTKEWEAVRRKLKIEFKRAGITTCELGYPGCWHNDALSFSHSKKRRNIRGNEIETVILTCSTVCHQKIELLPEAEMERVVLEVIGLRFVPVASIFARSEGEKEKESF